jgi:hypothetical protein
LELEELRTGAWKSSKTVRSHAAEYFSTASNKIKESSSNTGSFHYLVKVLMAESSFEPFDEHEDGGDE